MPRRESPARAVLDAARSPRARARVRLHPHGLDLGDGEVLPLWAGAMHYWRHPRGEWRAGPRGDARDGAAPRRHLRALGRARDRARRVRLRRARPAPRRRALPRDGARASACAACCGRARTSTRSSRTSASPSASSGTRECQARTPGGHPVMLPIVPVAFPVPSYASDAFLEETARWYRAVGKRLSRLRWPDGPIVLVQVDNEGALYFRDGATIRTTTRTRCSAFREFLRAKYRAACARCATRGATTTLDVRDGRAAAALRRARDAATSRATSTGPSSTSSCSSTAMERMAARARRRGLRRPADDAQPAARRGRDAAQPGAHDGDRPGRARLLPPRHARRALDHPPPHDRARVPLRGARRARPSAPRSARASRRSSRRSTSTTRSTR